MHLDVETASCVAFAGATLHGTAGLQFAIGTTRLTGTTKDSVLIVSEIEIADITSHLFFWHFLYQFTCRIRCFYNVSSLRWAYLCHICGLLREEFPESVHDDLAR